MFYLCLFRTSERIWTKMGNCLWSPFTKVQWHVHVILCNLTFDPCSNSRPSGLQRVVLFTEELSVYKVLLESEKVQHADQEIVLSLQSVGVSLVNNSTSQEVSFIGITRYTTSPTSLTQLLFTCTKHWRAEYDTITKQGYRADTEDLFEPFSSCFPPSSDVVWEYEPKKKKRWKTLTTKEAAMLERNYQSYIESGQVDNSIVNLENGFQVWETELLIWSGLFFITLHRIWWMALVFLQVSFTPTGAGMQMFQPTDARLRRHFLPGVKIEYSVSPRQKAYRVQIDPRGHEGVKGVKGMGGPASRSPSWHLARDKRGAGVRASVLCVKSLFTSS